MSDRVFVNSNDRCFLNKLPREVLLETLTYLPLQDLVNFQVTSRASNNMVKCHGVVLALAAIRDCCDKSMIPLLMAQHAAAVAPWKPSKLKPSPGPEYQAVLEYCEQYLVLGSKAILPPQSRGLQAAFRIISFYDASLDVARLCCLVKNRDVHGTHASNELLARNHKALYRMSIITHLFHSYGQFKDMDQEPWDVFSQYLSEENKMDVMSIDHCLYVIFVNDMYKGPNRRKFYPSERCATKCLLGYGIERLILPLGRRISPQDKAVRQRLSEALETNQNARTTLWPELQVKVQHRTIGALFDMLFRASPESRIAQQRRLAMAARLLSIRNREEFWWFMELAEGPVRDSD